MRYVTFIFVLMALLALIVGGCERKVTNEIVQDPNFSGADACMTCHNDVDGKLQQAEGEWANSVHASGTSVDYTNRGDGSDCTQCHDHQGFVDFITTGQTNAPYANVSAIHCFTCHAPHSTGTLALRAEDAYTLKNGVVFDHGDANLCANCHHNRTSVAAEVVDNKTLTTRFGPHHGPQADLNQGTGGYEYAGYTYDKSTHVTAVSNDCIGCHMGNPLEHDGYTIGGHSFNMIDEESGYSLVKICTGCHASAKSFDFKMDTTSAYDFDKDGVVEGYQTEFEGMTDSLAVVLYGKGVMTRTISGADTTYAPKAVTVADKGIVGAVWNYQMLKEDRSEGIHNWKYAHDLIWSSIEYVNTH